MPKMMDTTYTLYVGVLGQSFGTLQRAPAKIPCYGHSCPLEACKALQACGRKVRALARESQRPPSRATYVLIAASTAEDFCIETHRPKPFTIHKPARSFWNNPTIAGTCLLTSCTETSTGRRLQQREGPLEPSAHGRHAADDETALLPRCLVPFGFWSSGGICRGLASCIRFAALG